jgi:hypothetical protein
MKSIQFQRVFLSLSRINCGNYNSTIQSTMIGNKGIDIQMSRIYRQEFSHHMNAGHVSSCSLNSIIRSHQDVFHYINNAGDTTQPNFPIARIYRSICLNLVVVKIHISSETTVLVSSTMIGVDLFLSMLY